jgi:hypothetical protein
MNDEQSPPDLTPSQAMVAALEGYRTYGLFGGTPEWRDAAGRWHETRSGRFCRAPNYRRISFDDLARHIIQVAAKAEARALSTAVDSGSHRVVKD